MMQRNIRMFRLIQTNNVKKKGTRARGVQIWGFRYGHIIYTYFIFNIFFLLGRRKRFIENIVGWTAAHNCCCCCSETKRMVSTCNAFMKKRRTFFRSLWPRRRRAARPRSINRDDFVQLFRANEVMRI